MEIVLTMVVGKDVTLVKDEILSYSVHALGRQKEDLWGRWRATKMETYSWKINGTWAQVFDTKKKLLLETNSRPKESK